MKMFNHYQDWSANGFYIKNHLQNSTIFTFYISHNTQKTLIQICRELIQKNRTSKIKASMYYSILVDEIQNIFWLE